MKLFLSCTECLENIKDKTKAECIKTELKNENLYETTCSKGHKKTIILEEHRFEVLFDAGAIELLDGNPMEAVANFSYSLENFYEFCIELILTNNHIKYKNYENLWNMIKTSQESLMGAFCFLYLREFKEEPELLREEFVELRNDVTYRDYTPEYDEAFAYGNHLFNYMNDMLEFFRLTYSNGLNQFIINKMIRLNELAKKRGAQLITLSHPPIIHLPTDDKLFVAKNFKEALNLLNDYRTWIYTV